MKRPFTLVHVSDLHFNRIPARPSQWMSKRALGAVNLLLRRRRTFPLERARRLVRQLERMDWQHLLITGDLTQLALEEEFALARGILEPLLERGPGRVTILPGNHDRYVRESGGGGFEAYFGEFFGAGEIATAELAPGWSLAGWDSSLPTPPLMAWGRVREETLRATEEWLAGLPKGERVVLGNHYPLLYPPQFPPDSHHQLRRIEQLREWLSARPINLYLHGHVHSNWIIRPGEGELSCTHVNSASSTRVPRAGESSAFHRIELEGQQFTVHPVALD